MGVPGVGPVTALSVWAAIDDPGRFARSSSVGAYLGLTPRPYASGEVDRSGRISKCGDREVRTHLYEAANVLLTRIRKPSALQDWGLRIARRSGFKKAKVAVARKLSIVLHRMWRDGSEFSRSPADAAHTRLLSTGANAAPRVRPRRDEGQSKVVPWNAAPTTGGRRRTPH